MLGRKLEDGWAMDREKSPPILLAAANGNAPEVGALIKGPSPPPAQTPSTEEQD